MQQKVTVEKDLHLKGCLLFLLNDLPLSVLHCIVAECNPYCLKELVGLYVKGREQFVSKIALENYLQTCYWIPEKFLVMKIKERCANSESENSKTIYP